MPSSQSSFRVTEAYRAGMLALRSRVESAASEGWTRLDLDDLDATYAGWRLSTTRALNAAQREGTRLSAAYLGAFLSSELGHRVRTPSPPASQVGVSRDGRALTDAYESPLIGILAALKEGKSRVEALDAGRERAMRAVALDSDTAVRESLTELMDADDQIVGWRRAVAGTCPACAGAASESVLPAGQSLQIHPGCRCVSEPALRRPESFPRLGGQQLFFSLSQRDQNAQFGLDQARMLRDGVIEVEDLVAVRNLAAADNFISAASQEEALANAAKRRR